MNNLRKKHHRPQQTPRPKNKNMKCSKCGKKIKRTNNYPNPVCFNCKKEKRNLRK